MGRGLGRGAKAVGVVTHMQAKDRKNKAPKGLRGTKRHRKEARLSREVDRQDGHVFKNEKTQSKKSIEDELNIHQMPFPVLSKTKKMRGLVQIVRAQAAGVNKKKQMQREKQKQQQHEQMAAAAVAASKQ
eukprot:PhM_4_TR15459/c0_g1_i1/m.26206